MSGFTQADVDRIAKCLSDLADQVEIAQASLEAPEDEVDARHFHALLTGLRDAAAMLVIDWEVTQRGAFPSSLPTKRRS